jgi:hypothetical protein
MDRILADYPGLTGEMVELSALYATLNPHKDTPPKSPPMLSHPIRSKSSGTDISPASETNPAHL